MKTNTWKNLVATDYNKNIRGYVADGMWRENLKSLDPELAKRWRKALKLERQKLQPTWDDAPTDVDGGLYYYPINIPSV